jgi:hypothetical protein
MGKGGQVTAGGRRSSQKATSPSSTAKNSKPKATNSAYDKVVLAYDKATANSKDDKWVSPFSPAKIDPRVAAKTVQEINDQFPTKSELRAVIPRHCFDRSLVKSFYYVFRDVTLGIVVWYLTAHVLQLPTDPPGPIWTWQWWVWRAAWNLYAVAMTMAVGGLWVIGKSNNLLLRVPL